MKKIMIIVLTLALVLGLMSCGTNPKPQGSTSSESQVETKANTDQTEEENKEESFKAQIFFCGSTSLYPIISSLASSFTEQYEKWNKVDASFPEKHISIYVAPGGSGVGVSAAIEKTADFGMLARAIKDSEVEALGENYQAFTVAKDALTVSVNAENPIVEKMDDMSKDLIRQIFSGELTTWNQVEESLPEEPINVYIRDLSGGAYEVFQKSIMGESEVTASATQSASMTELAKNIANDPWGIGYAGFGAYNKVNSEKKVLTAMKVGGVEPTEDTIISGEYVVQRPVMFVTGSVVTAPQQAFVDYIFSQKGYDTVVANGYIPAFTPSK